MYNKSHSDLFRYIQTHLGLLRNYSGPCLTLTYSETWNIQNLCIFRTRAIFRTLVYAGLWNIQNTDTFRTLSSIYDRAFCENS